MHKWLTALRRTVSSPAPAAIPETLWAAALHRYPFLAQDSPGANDALRELTRQFLHRKQFHGAHGLAITDAMAVDIAAQACLPLLHLAVPWRGLDWYSDFEGIVVHADAVVAPRESVDETGVVHRHDEVLSGEAMQDGPVMLAWRDVADAGATAAQGYNLVIHEFAHKLDMRDGAADGCPPLPHGFMGAGSARQARAQWTTTLTQAYESFCDQLSIAERFGGTAPWLDPYAAEGIDEFFAVACEAYFVNRPAFERELVGLAPMFDAFFRPAALPD